MASAAKFFKIGCGIFGGLAVLVIAAIALLAFFSKPPPPFTERLAALPAAEREALEAVAKAAGLAIADFRDVGAGAPLYDARNFRAVAVERGHVRTLSLQELHLESLPSFSAFAELEQLSLRGNALKALPDLAGCAALKTLDLSRNQMAQLERGHLPAGLKQLDLSQNPVSDLAPLADLTRAEEIHVREAKVTAFDPLIDLPLRMLDLAKNPISRTPARLPKSPDFRVDLDDCPVSTPPGYLKQWSFKIRQSGVVGERQSSSGLVTPGKFEATGTWKVVPQLTTVELLTSPAAKSASGVGAMDLEVKVTEGRLRVYLSEAAESRGEWFAKGFVKGTDGFFKSVAKLYADAEPGHPARLHGWLEHFQNQPYYFYVEPLPSAPVKEMSYRAWKD